MALSEKQRAQLAESIPRDAVSQRDSGGKTLDYVEGWWVIAELNRILGPDGWSFSILSREIIEMPHKVETKKGPRWCCSVIVSGRIEVGDVHREDVGFGSGVASVKSNAGETGSVIESAIKEAATDALKRCARQLGHRTGGALYDKQRTHVDDTPQWAKDALGAVADLRVEAEAGKGSAVAAAKAVAEYRAAIVKLPKAYKATVLEDLTAVAELVAEGDARAIALEWITGGKTPGKAA